MKTKTFIILLSIILLSVGCGSFGYSVSAKDPDYVATIVFGTLGASTPIPTSPDAVMSENFSDSVDQGGGVSGAIA